MNAIRGTWYLSAWRQTVSLWASTPSRALNTTTPPSSTRRLRSTSAVKSTWPGRVDQVDRAVLPGKRDGRGPDRDAPLLLLGIEVGDGGALVDFAHAVAGAAVVQHPLGDGGLAGVDVGDDADVARVVRSCVAMVILNRPAAGGRQCDPRIPGESAAGELSRQPPCRLRVLLPSGRRRATPRRARMRSRTRRVCYARSYQAKCAKALLASAMRCTFSRRVMAVPSFL